MNLIKKYRSITLFCGGAILGFLIFLFIFDYHTLNPINDFFCTTGYIENDSAQHYAGWMLFRNSEWTFPIGVTERISYPFGNSVIYTDSIPLFAVFFKLLSPILPTTFQYFGMYVALCFMLMGGFSALLIDMFSKNTIFSLAGSLLFSLSPIMIERAFRHTALTSHFLIIAALYYYFKATKNKNIRNFIPLFVINILAITIHPYFLPFTFAISLAFCIEWMISKKEYLKSILLLCASIATSLFVGFLLGMFHISGGAAAHGYGVFSLNLINFINPTSVGFSEWSQFLPNFDLILTDGHTYQIESFNYLGFGVIVAFVAMFIYGLAVKVHRDKLISLIKRYFALFVVSALLTVFAMSNVVTFGVHQIASFTLPSFLDDFASIFRASGRFAWIVVYLVFLFVVYMLSKLHIPKFKHLNTVLLLVIFAVQLFDFSGVLGRKQDYFNGNVETADSQMKHPYFTHSFWDRAFEDFSNFITLEDTSIHAPNAGIELAIAASKGNTNINVSFAARNSDEIITDYRMGLTANLIAGIVDENTLYLTAEPEKFAHLVESGFYQIFYVDSQYVLFKSRYAEEEINRFISDGNFDYWGSDN